MRYVLVLLLGSIAWTAPAFAQVPDETGKAEKVHVQEIGKGGAFAPFPSALDQLQAPDPLGRKVHVQEIDKGGGVRPCPINLHNMAIVRGDPGRIRGPRAALPRYRYLFPSV